MAKRKPAGETEFQRKQQDKWLDAFDKAGPSSRHQLLLEALRAEKLFLGPEALGFAAATVNQMLAHFNQLDQLRELSGLLQKRSPEAFAMLFAGIRMLELSEALFARQSERIPELLQGLLSYPGELPAAQWQMILEQLAYYGHGRLAADAAKKLEKKLGDPVLEIEQDLDWCLLSLRINWMLEKYMRSGRSDEDRRALQQEIRECVNEDEDIRFYLRQADSSEAEQIERLRAALMRRDVVDAMSHAQLAFGIWMLDKYSLGLYTSAKMMECVFAIWTMPPLKGAPALDRIARLTLEQLLESFDAYEEGGDLLESFVYCWGLPHVYDWLQSHDLIQARDAAKITAYMEQLKDMIYDNRGLALWSFDFVHDWPRPASLSEEAFAAEAQAFRETHGKNVPLSDNPADNEIFDEAYDDYDDYDDDPQMQAMSQEMIDDLLRHLASLSEGERAHMFKVMEAEFGPIAADMVKSMFQGYLQAHGHANGHVHGPDCQHDHGSQEKDKGKKGKKGKPRK